MNKRIVLLILTILIYVNIAKKIDKNEFSSRIAFGKISTKNQFPWHVSIKFFADQRIHYCGGSIISKRWVLTAAHCVYNRKSVTLGFGSNNLNEPLVEMESSKFEILWAYTPQQYAYDIALIKLPKPLVYSNSIRPVKLPTLEQTDFTFENKSALISGFGRLSFQGDLSNTLNYVTVRIISNAKCKKYYIPEIIRPSIMCSQGAPDPLAGPCPGDSGGALVSEDEDENWMQIGIMLFVQDGSCTSGKPAGFTRLTFFMEWISDITGIDV